MRMGFGADCRAETHLCGDGTAGEAGGHWGNESIGTNKGSQGRKRNLLEHDGAVQILYKDAMSVTSLSCY